MAQAPREATVWMTYVNVVNGLDEDFRDMKGARHPRRRDKHLSRHLGGR